MTHRATWLIVMPWLTSVNSLAMDYVLKIHQRLHAL